jgi:hypothetical protein
VSVGFDTVAGVLHVRNSGTPQRWSLSEILTLGAVGSAEPFPQEFGRIVGVVLDEAGLVYVADGEAHEIRVFDDGGALVRAIGREGGGPGEFGALQSIGWLGDRLMTLDPANARIGLLSAEGEWLGQRPYLALTGSAVRIHTTGPGEAYTPGVRLKDDGADRIFVRQTLEGTADTVIVPPSEEATGYVVCTGENGIGFRRVPFAPRTLEVPAPGVLLVEVWTADYRIAFLDPTGDTTRVVERDLPTLPVTDSVWSADAVAFEEFLAQWPGSRCEPPRPERPEAMDMIRVVFFDGEGRMWVERREGAGWALDAFGGQGRLLGTVPIPERLERILPWVRGDRLLLVVTDDLDVEYVKVVRIEGMGS